MCLSTQTLHASLLECMDDWPADTHRGRIVCEVENLQLSAVTVSISIQTNINTGLVRHTRMYVKMRCTLTMRIYIYLYGQALARGRMSAINRNGHATTAACRFHSRVGTSLYSHSLQMHTNSGTSKGDSRWSTKQAANKYSGSFAHVLSLVRSIVSICAHTSGHMICTMYIWINMHLPIHTRYPSFKACRYISAWHAFSIHTPAAVLFHSYTGIRACICTDLRAHTYTRYPWFSVHKYVNIYIYIYIRI